MINVSTRWLPWTGSAVAAAAADYTDIKFQPISSRLTNGEIVALGAVAADVFNLGGRYRPAVTAASDWAVGSLVSTFVRSHITPPVSSVSTKTVSSGVSATGVPASGGSAAFDLPTGGY